MTELGPVLWTAYVVPPLRSVVHPAFRLARGTVASLTTGALRLELALERRLMAPGPPDAEADRGM